MGATTKVHKFSGGRLIATPLNTTAPESDCGGTQLGTIQNVRVQITEKHEPITAEEWGSATIDGTVLDHEIFMTVVGTGWDEDFVSTVLYGGSTGSGTPVLSYPNNVGGLCSAKGVKLLWLPNDDAEDPAFIAYNAIPWSLPKPVYFSGRRPAVVTATFLCTRDGTNRVWESDLLANLSV